MTFPRNGEAYGREPEMLVMFDDRRCCHDLWNGLAFNLLVVGLINTCGFVAVSLLMV